MKPDKIDIRNRTLFPWHFQFIAVLILLAGIALLMEMPVMGLVLIIAAGFILTAADGTEIDTTKGRYREYNSFYFIIRSGKWKKYPGAEKIYINGAKTTTRTYTMRTNQSAVFTSDEFNGYLKLVTGEKIHLMNSHRKQKLTTSLQKAASFLECPLQDNTLV